MKRITAFYLLLFLAAHAHAADTFFDERGAGFTKSGVWVDIPYQSTAYLSTAYLGRTLRTTTSGSWGQFSFS